MTHTQCLLTIAGTDPSGGAGVQVDLQVFRDWGFHGLSAITAIVAQNTAGVRRFESVSGQLVWEQLASVLEDVEPAGIKIGMVSSAAVVDEIADVLYDVRAQLGCPVVFDPVMASGASQSLQRPGTLQAMRNRLIPLVDVLTPNVGEAETLLEAEIGDEDELCDAAARLRDLGCESVLLKVGHLPGRGERLADVLATPDGVESLEALEAVDTDVRGTGCQLSSALVAALAQGMPTAEAAEAARAYLNRLLHTRREQIGRGRPVVVRAESSHEHSGS